DRVRRIPLSSLAIEALRRERLRQSEDAFRVQGFLPSEASPYVDHGYVFQDEFGRPYRVDALTEAFGEIRSSIGVTKRLHDARHTAASHLLAAGVDVRTTATILGHSSPQTTLNIYAHQMAGLQEAAIEKLDGRLKAIKRRGPSQ
ncbi:MAG: tyrosine-type recombinase/integrase, partial [Vulcanimicrobiaceae bacterium]